MYCLTIYNRWQQWTGWSAERLTDVWWEKMRVLDTKCIHKRAMKRNGEAHNRCEKHRIKCNMIQRWCDPKCRGSREFRITSGEQIGRKEFYLLQIHFNRYINIKPVAYNSPSGIHEYQLDLGAEAFSQSNFESIESSIVFMAFADIHPLMKLQYRMSTAGSLNAILVKRFF